MRLGRIVASVLFGLIIVGGLQSQYLRALCGDAEAQRRVLPQDPDALMPRYAMFLREVARATKPGESLAIAVPMRHWHRGYEFAFYRAVYFLPGRQVIPLVSPDGRLHLDRIAEADFVAAWEIPLPAQEPRRLWSAHGGALLRRPW